METKANYVLIGAFTLGVVAFLLLFALWAARWSSQQAWDFYDVIFNEAVTGLSEGGTVQYNGIAVGTVEDLSLMPNDPRKVVARIRLDAARASMPTTSCCWTCGASIRTTTNPVVRAAPPR